MDEISNVPPPPPAPEPVGTDNQRMMSIASLVIGIVNLCAWLLPICGVPLGIVGIVLGVLGMKSPAQKNLAIAGIALSGIGVLLACVNAVLGVALQPQIQEIINQSVP